jgi:hypothetical protein
MRKIRERSYPILKTGNFYFPYIDRKEKFTVEDTLELEIDRKEFALLERIEKISKLKRFRKLKQIYFSEYARPIWEALKKIIKNRREYHNCWFVPIRFVDYGKKNISVSVDVLRKVN